MELGTIEHPANIHNSRPEGNIISYLFATGAVVGAEKSFIER
jgi:hypothetical protein